MQDQNTQSIARDTSGVTRTAHVTPVGGYGTVTEVGDGPGALLICRTDRRGRGWGVHTADGTLLVSGWPTRTRALAYAQRRVGAAR